MKSTAALPDALRDALGHVIANERREWRRERELIEAQSREAIAELRARVVELEGGVKESVATRLNAVRDGKDGDPGAPGPQGERGLQGDPGEPGTVGLQGEPGERGADGRDGVDGINGRDGVDGAPGVAGEKGERGEPGPAGDRGERGSDGENADPLEVARIVEAKLTAESAVRQIETAPADVADLIARSVRLIAEAPGATAAPVQMPSVVVNMPTPAERKIGRKRIVTSRNADGNLVAEVTETEE